MEKEMMDIWKRLFEAILEEGKTIYTEIQEKMLRGKNEQEKGEIIEELIYDYQDGMTPYEYLYEIENYMEHNRKMCSTMRPEEIIGEAMLEDRYEEDEEDEKEEE